MTKLKDEGRRILKELLPKCNEKQQLMFKRMYSHNNLNATIDEAVDNMDDSKIEWAIEQVERTIEKNVINEK